MHSENHLTSLTNSKVKQAVRLRQKKHRCETKLFIAEGVREITRALTCGFKTQATYLCPEKLKLTNSNKTLKENVAYLLGLDLKNTPCNIETIFTVSEPVFAKMAYRQNPQGILAVFHQNIYKLTDIGPIKNNELWLVTVGASKPGNVGAMARSAAAAGATGILIADADVDIFNPNAIRASTGAVFSEIMIASTSEEIRNFLQKRKIKLISTAPPTAGDNTIGSEISSSHIYSQVDMTGPVAIVIGAEDRGLDDQWERFESPDDGICVTIPMAGEVVDSLNASAAASVLLFEAVRQRN